MSLLNILGISGSAVSAQSQRLNVVASNLANADSVAGPDGQSYKARQVVFQTEQHAGVARGTSGVRVSNVVEDATPGRRLHDPQFRRCRVVRQQSQGRGRWPPARPDRVCSATQCH